MKLNVRLILPVMLTAGLYAGKAQTVFPETAGLWQCEEITLFGTLKIFYDLCGDTVIAQEEYKKISRYSLNSNGEPVDKTYAGASRVTGDAVYYIPPGLVAERLLYDFSLVKGDTVALINFDNTPVQLIVDSTGLILIDGQEFKTIFFKPNNPVIEFWIEGIGSNRGPLTRGYQLIADYEPLLVCFKDSALFYSTGVADCTLDSLVLCGATTGTIPDLPVPAKLARIYPNPFLDFFVVEPQLTHRDKALRVTVFNGLGQMIFSADLSDQPLYIDTSDQWESGVYFFHISSRRQSQILLACKMEQSP